MEVQQSEYNKEEMREFYLDLRRAQSLAMWSYIGIFIPILGWILAGLSLSVLKNVPEIPKLEPKAYRIYNTAWTSIAISVVIVIVLVLLVATKN